MEPVKLTKGKVDRIMQIKGNVSGTIFCAYRNYIIKTKGEDALKQIEWRLEELGFPTKLKNYYSFKIYSQCILKHMLALFVLLFLKILNRKKTKHTKLAIKHRYTL